MGDAYSRRLNREGTAPEGVKFAIAAPVYNFDTEGVQICSSPRASSASWTAFQMEDYPTCWSMTSSSAKRAMAEHRVQPAPRPPQRQQRHHSGCLVQVSRRRLEIGRLTGETHSKRADHDSMDLEIALPSYSTRKAVRGALRLVQWFFRSSPAQD